MNIDGGQRKGNNLFYSLEKFSITEGTEAIFANAPDVENIFVRITGESISYINGVLRTRGEANFFLVNPRGIIFEENVRLDVNGSFVATTANSIQFEDGTKLLASESEPILTISVPVRLNFDGNSVAVTVNGTGNQIVSESSVSQIKSAQIPRGISVPSERTFALVGNGVNLNGGIVSTTENGQICLSSLNFGSVDINRAKNGFTLTTSNVTEYQDINLDRQSLVDASGKQTGTISLTGKNINILNESFVLSQNRGDLPGGSLNIQASESLTVSGRSAKSDIRSSIRSESLNNGEGADLNISAHNVFFRNGARIRTNSFGKAVGGNIAIEASDSIQLTAPSSIIATTFAAGNAGNVSLSALQLRVDASGVGSSSNGNGNSGRLDITADSIEILGTSSIDRASITTATFAAGNASNLTLNTKKLQITDGASLSSSSFANGNAGDLTVNASKSVEVKGKRNSPKSTDNPHSTIRAAVQTVSPAARKALKLPDIPGGNSGNVTITTSVLSIVREGVVTVENQGSGIGGGLNINAKQLNLEEAGKITAATKSGTGGIVNLNTESIRIGTNSQIIATADNNSGSGNLTINTTSIIVEKQ